jgi:tripartite-type tricarboxylate transporter receptor subunit TctC
MRRDFLLSLGAAALSAWPALGRAQTTWPVRPVRIIVPSAPGSPWDPLARLLADRLAPVFGQPFIVENRSGATGTIGMKAVASDRDGHTLGVIFMPHVLVPSLFRTQTYDILADVAPVAQTQWSYNVLVTHPSVGAESVEGLVAMVRQRPGRLTLASGGNGTPAHVMGEYFKQTTKTFIVHVPYRGPVAALQDLVGGQVDMMFAASAAAIPQIRAGRLKALAVASPGRLAALPEVPTFAEVGYPRFDVRDWAGIVASPSVPGQMIGRLNEEILKVLAEPAVQQRFAQMGLTLYGSPPSELAGLMRSETEKWRQVIRTAGIKLED